MHTMPSNECANKEPRIPPNDHRIPIKQIICAVRFPANALRLKKTSKKKSRSSRNPLDSLKTKRRFLQIYLIYLLLFFNLFRWIGRISWNQDAWKRNWRVAPFCAAIICTSCSGLRLQALEYLSEPYEVQFERRIQIGLSLLRISRLTGQC